MQRMHENIKKIAIEAEATINEVEATLNTLCSDEAAKLIYKGLKVVLKKLETSFMAKNKRLLCNFGEVDESGGVDLSDLLASLTAWQQSLEAFDDFTLALDNS